ncbi:MAG: hypothetical protein ACOY0T_30700 [Myxococcota bacterium]
MEMKDMVDSIKQTSRGVSVHLGAGVELKKAQALAAKCGPGGPGCSSDCCTPEMRSAIKSMNATGKDGDVDLVIDGLSAEQVQANLAKCSCYNDA